jgi:acyl dehydratase
MAESAIATAARELEGMIGRTGPELHGSVSARDIARFAVASGDPSPIYTSEEEARAAGYEGIPCPPLLMSSVLEWGAGPALGELRADGTGVGREGWLPLAGLRLMGGGQDLDFHQPVLAGAEFVAEPVLTGVERKQGGSGDLILLTIESCYRSVAGEPLVTCRETLIAR